MKKVYSTDRREENMNLPNKLTILRIILIPLMAVLYFCGLHYAAAAVFLIAVITDVLDGKIARKHNLVTVFGKFLDPIADKLLNLSALLLVIWYQPNIFVTVCTMIIIAREFLVTGFRIVAASNQIIIAADRLGKIKTIVQDVAIIFLMIENWPFSFIGVPVDMILLGAAALMTIISGVNYIAKNAAVFKE